MIVYRIGVVGHVLTMAIPPKGFVGKFVVFLGNTSE